MGTENKNPAIRDASGARVARWFIFQPKIPIWVNLIYLMTIWNILRTFWDIL
jgi:hypothetical protein